MSRATELSLKPADHNGRCTVEVYTYDQDAKHVEMRETVYVEIDHDAGWTKVRLTAAEAKELAAHLLAVADRCEAEQQRREGSAE